MTIKSGISHRPKKNSPMEMWFHQFSAGFSVMLSDGERIGHEMAEAKNNARLRK